MLQGTQQVTLFGSLFPHTASAHLRCAVMHMGAVGFPRAGWVNLPLPAQAFTGARFAPARFGTHYRRHGIPWKKSLRLESERLLPTRWGNHSRSHQEVPTPPFHIGANKKRPPPGYGLEAPGRNRWRRREVWCLSGPCCSEWRAHWTEKVGNFSCFPRLSCPRV